MVIRVAVADEGLRPLFFAQGRAVERIHCRPIPCEDRDGTRFAENGSEGSPPIYRSGLRPLLSLRRPLRAHFRKSDVIDRFAVGAAQAYPCNNKGGA
jgi:hypothetical protein